MLAVTRTSWSPIRTGRPTALAEPLRDRGRFFVAHDRLAQHDELVAAESGHGVARADHLLEPDADGQQQLVARRRGRTRRSPP